MAKKMKTNQDGGGKSSTAAAGELKNNQKTEGAGKGMDHKKGAAKYVKGAADYSVKKGSHDHPHGAPKMGYNQSFGAARVSGYSKGAAKVADIMSFGASKYIKHGAADAGHGGPDGHQHASKTILKRETSGGGSNSSNSSTSGGDGKIKTGKDVGVSQNEVNAYNMKTYGTLTPTKDGLTNNRSSSSSTSSGGGSSTTTSNTVVSKNSMAESKLGGSILAENRNQLNSFNKSETNIKASNDSITKANDYLNKLPAFKQSLPRYTDAASKRGGEAAFKTRVKSGDYSPQEAMKIYRSGQPQR